MANWSNPTLSSTYTNFVSEVTGRDVDLALGMDPAFATVTNPPTNAIRWTSASGKWQKWSGTAWGDLASVYNINVAGTLTAPAGAVGTPSIAFAGSATTGLYSPGANQVALAVAGTQRLFVSSAGRFSFGAGASPAAPVTVAGGGFAVQETAVNRALSFLDATGATTYATFGADFSGANKITYVNSPQAGSKVSVQVAGSERMAVTDTAATLTVPLTLPALAVSTTGNTAAPASFVRNVATSVRALVPISAATTLTSSALGGLHALSGTGYTVALPVASSLISGGAISFTHVGTGPITLARQGTDTISGNGATGSTTLTLYPGDSGAIYADGTAVFYSCIDSQASGTYAPTFTTTDATFSLLTNFRWTRLGRVVSVSGICPGTVSTTGSGVIGTMSLPIPSAFTSRTYLAGSLKTNFTNLSQEFISADAATDTAIFAIIGSVTSGTGFDMNVNFTYLLI